MPCAVPGGPKLVSINLSNNSIVRVYTLPANVPSYNGIPLYLRENGHPLSLQQEGLDGIELSLYGDVSYNHTLQYCSADVSQIMHHSPLTSDSLYPIETKYLRTNPSNNTLAAKHAFDNVKNLCQRGGNVNGFSPDSLGNVYMLMPSRLVHNSGNTV
jgi:hypothetical protein